MTWLELISAAVGVLTMVVLTVAAVQLSAPWPRHPPPEPRRIKPPREWPARRPRK